MAFLGNVPWLCSLALLVFGAFGCNHDTPTDEVKRIEAARQAERIARGDELYGRMCKVCHGANGEGYKADQAPALVHPDFLASVEDDSLYGSIADGRPGTTMSAWSAARGGPLSQGDIEALIAHLRSWQKGPRATLDERRQTGDIGRGLVIYDRECVRCHGAKGVGGPNIHIGDSAWLSRTSNGFLRYAIEKGRAPTSMPGFAATLGPAGIEDVLAALRSFPQPIAAANARPARAFPPPLPLGPVPLHPKGPEPEGFVIHPGTTHAELVHAQLERGARLAILDARAPTDYTNEHIAGAVSVPFYDPTPYFDKLPRDAWLVCYCACPHAESGELAGKLVAAGFKKVTVLDEGLGFWKTKGFKTSTGDKP